VSSLSAGSADWTAKPVEGGIEACGEVVEGDRLDVRHDPGGAAHVVGDGLEVGDEEGLLDAALKRDAASERPARWPR
jgi:hypothetical protein